jgi:ribonuclease HII
MSQAQLVLASGEIGRLKFRSYEEESFARGYHSIAGIDEVGRGPLAGPVVAAAVIFPRGYVHADIRDSKLMTAKQRERVAQVIQQSALAWAIGVADVHEIDRLNILQASLLAMVKALAALKAKVDCVLIDGNQTIPLGLFRTGRFAEGRVLYQRTIIKGDQRCVSIAAASIVAKVARDRIMAKLDLKYPEYGFADHKGYSCAAHFEALRRLGPSPAHRKSFRPVRLLCDDGKSLGPLFD